MEKAQSAVHRHQKLAKADQVNKSNINNNKRAIWDCGSNLYDSFELNSFQKQLDSAIISSSRTFSMPRLPSDTQKKPVGSRFSRSFQKLLPSIFRSPRPNNTSSSKPNSNSSPDPWFLGPQAQTEKDKVMDDPDGGRCFAVYEKAHGLSTIPEVPEVAFSPEIGSFVGKTMSDRFKPACVGGIYCT